MQSYICNEQHETEARKSNQQHIYGEWTRKWIGFRGIGCGVFFAELQIPVIVFTWKIRKKKQDSSRLTSMGKLRNEVSVSSHYSFSTRDTCFSWFFLLSAPTAGNWIDLMFGPFSADKMLNYGFRRCKTQWFRSTSIWDVSSRKLETFLLLPEVENTFLVSMIESRRLNLILLSDYCDFS